MEDKKADNRIYESKKQIERLDEQIYNNQKSLEKLDRLEESFANINRCLNKCIDLVNKSVKGKKVTRRMDEMSSENKERFRKTMYSIDDDRRQLKNEIDRLNDEKDETIKQIKKEIDKQSKEDEDNKEENNKTQKE